MANGTVIGIDLGTTNCAIAKSTGASVEVLPIAQLTGPGEPAADFMIEGPKQHGLDGLIHLFGIESPGLTSALSLADELAGYL